MRYEGGVREGGGGREGGKGRRVKGEGRGKGGRRVKRKEKDETWGREREIAETYFTR